MATKKKSKTLLVAEALEQSAWQQADYWFDVAVENLVKTSKLKNQLWAAEQEVHDLKYELERQRENAVEVCDILTANNKQLRNKIDSQNSIIDDFIEENLNLHHELILQRDCNRMAHEVVQLANELHKPGDKIDVPAGVSPQDALKLHQAAISKSFKNQSFSNATYDFWLET